MNVRRETKVLMTREIVNRNINLKKTHVLVLAEAIFSRMDRSLRSVKSMEHGHYGN